MGVGGGDCMSYATPKKGPKKKGMTKKQTEPVPVPDTDTEIASLLQEGEMPTNEATEPQDVKVVSPTIGDPEGKTGIKEEIKAEVEVSTKQGSHPPEIVKQTDEKIGFHVFKTQPAIVSVRLGTTLNLGNYRSARVEVGISMPCYAEQVGEAYSDALDFVQTRLTQEAEAVIANENAVTTKDKEAVSQFESAGTSQSPNWNQKKQLAAGKTGTVGAGKYEF